MQKVLFVIDVMRKGGGAQKVIAILLPALQERGFFVELVVLKKTERLLEIPNVKTYYILSNEEQSLTQNSFEILDQLTKLFGGFDLICSFMDFITSYFVALGSRLSLKPYYIFVRCEPSFVAKNFLHTQINLSLYALCLQNALKVICNSKSSCLDIEKNFNVSKDKIYLLYNPINAQQILENSKKEVEIKLPQREPGEIFCIAVGRLQPQKNYHTLLKAFLALRGEKIKLFILGDGEMREEIEGFIQKHKMTNVVLLGYQNNIYPFLAQADIFVHSSLSEGFPNAILEAAFLKKPLILSDITTHREIFAIGGAEFFMPEDIEGLVKLLRKVARDEQERVRLSQGTERALTEYQNKSFEKMLDKIFVRKAFV